MQTFYKMYKDLVLLSRVVEMSNLKQKISHRPSGFTYLLIYLAHSWKIQSKILIVATPFACGPCIHENYMRYSEMKQR